MSHFLQHYTLKFTPLSPVHIGTGDSYEPTNYVIDDDTLYEFDTGGAIAAFSEVDRNELAKAVNGKPNADMLKSVQRFFYDRREALKPWAVNAIPVLDGVANLYGSRVGQAANREGNGSQVINKLEIDRTAYNPVTRQPVLYGSSIKGAIRTALLNHLNDKESLSRQDAEKFVLEDLDQQERKRRERDQRKVYPKLNEKLFEFTAGKFELDPMRLLQIGDASWSNDNQLPCAEVLVTVNRKKELKRDKHGNEIFSQAEKNENLCKLLECISAWGYRAFSGQLNLQGMHKIPNSTKQPNAELVFPIELIAKYCSKFYLPILKAEMKIMRERGFLDEAWDMNIQALLAKMANKLLTGQVFLLRVGRHSGAESLTIDGVRHIKIMKGSPEYQPQTKTLWLAANHPRQRTNLLPFGWLLVEIHPGDAQVSEWPELAELCQTQHSKAQQWANRQASQKTELAVKRQAAEQRQQQESIERQQRLEQERAAEQARHAKQQADQQRMATMTPEQLQIETLRQAFLQKQTSNVREQIGGPLYGDLRKLIEQASEWPDESKIELLNLAKTVLEFMGATGNKKAKELLKTLISA